MASTATRTRRTLNVWPGYVDALATLLLSVVFLLTVFVVGQFFLSQELTGRDETLAKLNRQIADLTDLLALERTNRRLPVIVLAAGVTRQPFVALETLTHRLAGAAHVLGLTDECSTLLRARVGKDLSVFDGAVRMYRPGLQFDEADPYDHPLWLAHAGRPPTDGAPVISRVLASGVAKGTTDYPRFEAVRQAAAERTIEEHRSVATDTELARILEAQATTLREQLESLREEQNQWLADEERERSSAEQQIAELRAEFRRVRAQNESLRAAMASGDAPAIVKPPLTDLESFGTWAASNISPNIYLAPKAIKETERNVQYRNPEEIGAALYALDELYVPMRRHPDDERHRAWIAKMTELGITLTPCFTRDGDIQRYPEYSVQYRGQKRWCDLHVRHGGGTDPRAMFRIYIHWDEDEGVLLVGHMPTHLDNNMTN